MANDALINLTGPQFAELMRTEGLENTVRGVLEIANEEIDTAGAPLTLESLKDGTHPLLDKLDRYSGLAPENRQIGEEEILTLFTNVEDFGKYDPQDDSSAGLEAFGTGLVRAVPEGTGMALGLKTGLATGAKLTSWIPPTPPGLVIKGIAIGAGGLTGLIAGAFAGGKAEDVLFEEEAPVVPSLRRPYAAGETLTYAASGAAGLLTKAPFIPRVKTGAVEFLEQFKNAAGKKIDKETFTTYAKNSGMKQKQADDLYEQAMKARQARSEGGQMFGGEYGFNLGLTRFNPTGRVFDPLKGPVSSRTVAGIEKGVEASLKLARENPGKFLAIEGLSGGGASLGAYVTDPYKTGERLFGEVVGSLFPPLIVTTVGTAAAKGIPSVWDKVTGWYGNRDKTGALLTSKLEESAVDDIMKAIRKSEEYKDVPGAKPGEIEVTAEEKLGIFIDELIAVGARDAEEVQEFNKKFAADIAEGKVEAQVPRTASDLATANNLPYSKTLRTLQNELEKTSKDLQVATGTGREQLQTGAVFAIRALAATGDPQALVVASRITQKLMEQNLVDNIDTAVTTLNEAAVRVLGREPVDGSQQGVLSNDLYKVLENQIAISKNREKKLWGDVGNYTLTEFYSKNGRKIDEPNILRILDRSAKQGGLKFSSKGRQRTFNEALGGYKDDITDLKEFFINGRGRNPATAQRLFEMRSGLLEKAAQLRKAGNLQDARALNALSDAVLQDLTSQRNVVNEAYNAARAYTFARNNVFTRSFLKDLQIYDKDRALILDPEQLLEKAFRGGYTKANQAIDDIRDASKFLVDQEILSESDSLLLTTDQLVTAGLRDFMQKVGVVQTRRVKDPLSDLEGRSNTIETFVVDPRRFDTESRKPGFKKFIEKVPGLAEDLANAETAQKTFNNMLGDVTSALNPREAKAQLKYTDEQLNNLYGTRAFQIILENENPQKAVADALSSKNPTIAMNALYRMVNNADMSNELAEGFTKSQALEGLKQAIYSYAVKQASKPKSTRLDGDILQKTLFEQAENVAPNVNFNLGDFMKDKGLATADEIVEVEGHIKNIKGIQEALSTGDFEGVLFKNPSMSKLFTVRIAGATAGSAFQQKLKSVLGLPQMSGGLIAEQTGSELVQKLFLQAPEAQRNKILVNLFSSPEAMGAMMKTIKTKKDLKDSMTIIEKVVKPLVEQVGKRTPYVVRAIEEDTVEETVPEAVPPPQASLQPVPQFMDRESRQLQGAGTPPTMSPPPAAPAPAPSGPVDRSQYAALFPSDITSSLIRAQDQGIGSLGG
jgi:hypothetical protein